MTGRRFTQYDLFCNLLHFHHLSSPKPDIQLHNFMAWCFDISDFGLDSVSVTFFVGCQQKNPSWHLAITEWYAMQSMVRREVMRKGIFAQSAVRWCGRANPCPGRIWAYGGSPRLEIKSLPNLIRQHSLYSLVHNSSDKLKMCPTRKKTWHLCVCVCFLSTPVLMHGGLLCIAFCPSVRLSVRDLTKIQTRS